VANNPPKASEFKRFEALARKLGSVPKAELDERRAAKVKRVRKPKPA
jgi:hypothetical protein